MCLDSREHEWGRLRRYRCNAGHRYDTSEILIMHDELKTVLRDKNGSISVGTDPLKIFRERAIRAIEAAL